MTASPQTPNGREGATNTYLSLRRYCIRKVRDSGAVKGGGSQQPPRGHGFLSSPNRTRPSYARMVQEFLHQRVFTRHSFDHQPDPSASHDRQSRRCEPSQ